MAMHGDQCPLQCEITCSVTITDQKMLIFYILLVIMVSPVSLMYYNSTNTDACKGYRPFITY